MNITHAIDALRPNVSLRSVASVIILTVAVAASEAPLFFGHIQYTIWAYFVLLLALSLAPLFLEKDAPVFQAFALIPVFRLVNLTMPIFIDLTLLWFPLIYSPLVPVFVYLGRQTSVDEISNRVEITHELDEKQTTDSSGRDIPLHLTALSEQDIELSAASVSQRTNEQSNTNSRGIGHELPWWLGGDRGGKLRWLARVIIQFLVPPKDAGAERSFVRLVWYVVTRGLFVMLLPFAVVGYVVLAFGLTVYLAEIEYGIITPTPLISTLNFFQLALLMVVMIGFVGFVEELLFRGILQKVLERQLGLVPGLLLASGIFGMMHSVYGVPMEIVFAGVIGLVFGIIYDVTDSLVLVSVMHGLLNVFLFGIIPLDGGSSIDLLRAIAVELQHAGPIWRVDTLPLVDLWMLVS